MPINVIDIKSLRELLETLKSQKSKMSEFITRSKLERKELKLKKKDMKSSGENLKSLKLKIKQIKVDLKVIKECLKRTSVKITALEKTLSALDNKDFQRMWDPEDMKLVDRALLIMDKKQQNNPLENYENITNQDNVEEREKPSNEKSEEAYTDLPPIITSDDLHKKNDSGNDDDSNGKW